MPDADRVGNAEDRTGEDGDLWGGKCHTVYVADVREVSPTFPISELERVSKDRPLRRLLQIS